MEKVIVAIDGLKYSGSVVAYAIEIARKASSHLVGVFLDDFSRHNFGMVDLASHEGSFESYYRQLRHHDDEDRKHAAAIFAETCTKAGVHFSIHHDKDIAQRELAIESLYADLVIVDKTQTFSRYEQPSPSPFIKDVLESVQCPILLVPEHYRPVEKIVILFDGTPSSVFASRMFHQLLPVFQTSDVVVLTIQESNPHSTVTEKNLMKEFVGLQYRNARFVTIKGDLEYQVTRYLSDQKKETLVVLGAYDRGRISRWAKTSLADVLLNNLQFPLFVAHQKR